MISVLGLGNVLMGDDGFGPLVIRAFDNAYDAGPNVDVVDVGTPGLDLMPWLVEADHAILVDTVKNNDNPGVLRVYGKGDIQRRTASIRTGPHDPGVREALWTLEFAGRGPRTVTLIGIAPLDVSMGTDVSQPVRTAVAAAVDAIVQALTSLGEPPKRRVSAAPAPPWWTSTPA